mgnify:CR=1 FL=1
MLSSCLPEVEDMWSGSHPMREPVNKIAVNPAILVERKCANKLISVSLGVFQRSLTGNLVDDRHV